VKEGPREYLRGWVVSKDCSLQLEASDRRRFRMEGDLPDAMEEKVRDGIVRQLVQNLARCRSDSEPEYGSKDARTLDPTLQQHFTGAQPGAERQTDARLGEKTTLNRREQKEPEKS
jgi:hypothetical protein